MVFDKLAKFRYHVKCKKCQVFSKKVEFLGHTILASGIGVIQAKVEAINKQPQPVCIKNVQAFLGLAKYYQRFSKGFTQIALLLTNLTHTL